jgi:DNA-binding transcriptional LysR family regulator
LPPALAAFQKAVPPVKVVLHDLSSDELIAGLHNARLELAVMVQLTGPRGQLGASFPPPARDYSPTVSTIFPICSFDSMY